MRLPNFLRRRPFRRLARPGFASPAIGFSLTFAVAGVAVLAGWVPLSFVPGGVETSILLLTVPLVTLMLGLVAEVVRHEMAGPPLPAEVPAPAYRAGSREG